MCNFVTLVVSHLSRGMLCVHFYEYGIKVRLRQSAWRSCRWCLRSLFKLDLVNYLSSNQDQLLMVSGPRIRVAQQLKIVSIILKKDRKKRWGICKMATSVHTGKFLREKCNSHVVPWGSYHDKPKGKGYISVLSAPRFNQISTKRQARRRSTSLVVLLTQECSKLFSDDFQFVDTIQMVQQSVQSLAFLFFKGS